MSPISRRHFLRAAGGGVVALGGALLGSCDPGSDATSPIPLRRRFIDEDFSATGKGWGERWLNFRYDGVLETQGGAGVMHLAPAVPKATTLDKEHIDYMAHPVVVPEVQVGDVDVVCDVELDGYLEAGVLARSSFDESYALLVRRGRALLCRYGTDGRRILAQRGLPRSATEFRLTLRTRDRDVSALVEYGDAAARLRALDEDPLPAGIVGVVANPLDPEAGTRAIFRGFGATATDSTAPRTEELLYRFAGAVVHDGEGFKARVTARTVVPAEIAFEVATDHEFREARRTAPLGPNGKLGAVHGWLTDLAGNTTYHWRPVFRSSDEEVLGRPARFRTPPPAGGAASFIFASCTTGRLKSYPSFAGAAALNPHFYLHAGDWGYADLTSASRSADHFQARWIRLLRTTEVASLLDVSPLLFWQDDHDYNADNGWSGTIEPFAVTAFDELHANPTDDYFDVRWGDLHVFCLDCRLYATDPEAPDDERKSRLGSEQKAWLKRALKKSDAPVRIVASPMVFRNKVPEDPGWHNGYATERDELLEFFMGIDATLFILSGDSHGQRLIHHFEFGELYEINCSGTDFPGGTQGNNDPVHTLVNLSDSGFAAVELDAAGENRSVTVTVRASEDGSRLFSKNFDVLPKARRES